MSDTATEKSISFLYRCDVIEMIVAQKKKKNTIKQERAKVLHNFFYGHECTDSSYFQSCLTYLIQFLAVACKPWDHDTPSYTSIQN